MNTQENNETSQMRINITGLKDCTAYDEAFERAYGDLNLTR